MFSNTFLRITNFFTTYYDNLQKDPLFYCLPILFLLCFIYVIYVIVSTLADDQNWPPRKRNLRHLQDIVKIEGKYPYRRLNFQYQSVYQSIQNSKDYFVNISKRRSLRHFSTLAVHKQVVDNILRSTYSAPSYLNIKPFNFIAIFNREKLQQISSIFKNNNNTNKNNKNINNDDNIDNNDNYFDINKKLGIEETSEVIKSAPALVVFTKIIPANSDLDDIEMEEIEKSMGISLGFFLCAIHNAGLYGVVLSVKSEIKEELKQALQISDETRTIYSMVVIGYPEVGVDVPALPIHPLSSYSTYFD